MKTYRVGIVGFAHMHVNNVAALYAQHPQVEMVACADTTAVVPELRVAPYTREWNMNHALTDLGVKRGYDDYRTMLTTEKLDIVIVQSENAQHPDIIEACADVGSNVCVEKPLAASYSDALRIARAVEASGITVVTNWPMTWSSAARKAKQLLDEGVIGRVLEVKWRAGHTGPLGPAAAHEGVDEVVDGMTGPERGATWWHQAAPGGGAMLDYCCYGSMLAYWLIGEQATAALGMKANLNSHWGDAEDNAAMLVRFPGAMALLEGSWTTFDHGIPLGPVVYGTTGTLVIDGLYDQQTIRIERGHGDTTLYESNPLPENEGNVAEAYVHHLETGAPLHATLELYHNLDAMAILDAGVRSATTNKLEVVRTRTWQIG